MSADRTCPHCGDTQDPNRMCRSCLLAEARRLITRLPDDKIAEIMADVFKLDTSGQEALLND